MVANATEGLFKYINLDKYPLDKPDSEQWTQIVNDIKQELAEK